MIWIYKDFIIYIITLKLVYVYHYMKKICLGIYRKYK